MPESYRHERPYPGQGYTLKAAANDGLLLVVRCMRCRGPAVRFLAIDLVKFRDPYRYADEPPFACSKCGTAEFVRVKFHQPSLGDYGHLDVRRPGPVRHIQTWRTVKLGDNA